MEEIMNYWASETMGDWEAGQIPAKEAMKKWVGDVAAALAIAKENDKLQIWNAATQNISVDFEDEKRKIALLT